MILDVGPVGHGGICIAHAPDGRAVFVRHALPGEQVRVEITEERPSYLRADAVEILRASEHRVTPPCEWAGPGRCGGCDWQHVELDEQRRLKATVIGEQLRRIAGLDLPVVVEAVPGDVGGLHWRTRLRLAVDGDGVAGLHRHRSHEIEPIGDCLLAHPELPVASVVSQKWPDSDGVDLVVSDVESAVGRSWRIPAGGFWQVHPGAPEVLARTVVDFAAIAPSDVCLDLYCGVGLFAGVISPLASTGQVLAVESDSAAAAAARSNLADCPNVTVATGRVARWLSRSRPRADAVVLDPPRKGAGSAVVAGIAAAAPRRVVHVACDPSSLARDVSLFAGHGYRLEALRAFDLFPMTAHVECVALLVAEAAT
ncbi:MAG TPA: TRAM domain-containing protein [Mycobacteriales bacterium]|nr:TRAM domain-containing protein [Mycobacteriales bacterium]